MCWKNRRQTSNLSDTEAAKIKYILNQAVSNEHWDEKDLQFCRFSFAVFAFLPWLNVPDVWIYCQVPFQFLVFCIFLFYRPLVMMKLNWKSACHNLFGIYKGWEWCFPHGTRWVWKALFPWIIWTVCCTYLIDRFLMQPTGHTLNINNMSVHWSTTETHGSRNPIILRLFSRLHHRGCSSKKVLLIKIKDNIFHLKKTHTSKAPWWWLNIKQKSHTITKQLCGECNQNEAAHFKTSNQAALHTLSQ